MTTFEALLSRVKAQIKEISPRQVHQLLTAQEELELIDIRERDEYADGQIKEALLISRGVLDLRIEATVPDRKKRIILYCEGGTRSALAARSLQELGYQNVESMAGGFTAWKRAELPVHFPKVLSQEQLSRYSRHLLIPEIGERGQRRLLESKVLLLGAGGLGSPAALYLAAAGVGKIGLIDNDIVDRSNLQRQILHTEKSVGSLKVDSAERAIKARNSDVEVVKYNEWLTSQNVLEIFEGWDVVVDGGDNFATRYLVNDACVVLGIPTVHGSIFRFDGQVTTFDTAAGGPCYRCLYPEPPPPELAPSCQEAGVLGVLPGVIGMLQAIEVIKLVAQIGEPLKGRLMTFDALTTEFRTLKFRRDKDCPMCGDDAEFTGFIDYEEFCRAN